MNVLLTKALAATDLDYLRERLPSSVRWLEPPSFDETGVLARIDEADVLLGGLLSEAIAARAGEVRFFQVPWTGVDQLDFDLIERFGLTVCNSHSNAGVVAEHAVAMMLALAKKLAYHDRQLRGGHWNRVSPAGNAVSPFSQALAGTRVLLVGYGAIGRWIARLLSGFDCELSVVNASGRLQEERAAIQKVWPASGLLDALGEAERVFVSVPLTPATEGLFDAEAFVAMGADALLVNIARGVVIDEQALYEALAAGRIAGAAIDTWYAYPTRDEPDRLPSSRYPFHELDNLVLSPHRAGYAAGGFPHLDDAITNLERALAGEPPINRVSADRRY